MSAYCLGIDLGGSSIKSVALTPAGDLISRQNIDFDASQSMDWALRIRQLVQTLQSETGPNCVAIGLSAPGLAAQDGASIAYMPGRLQGLEGLNWTEFLDASTPIPVVNDAHAALLGEAWRGAARGLNHVVMLTLGTGVGGAAMVDGRLLHGHLGRAGHLGHICLDLQGAPGITRIPGSLEQLIGNCTIVERSAGRFHSTHDLVAAHRAGDLDASRIWLQSVDALACALASFINIFDPEAVVIGGGIARAGEVLFEPLMAKLDTIEWRPGGQRVRVLAAELGEFAGALGAAWTAQNRVSA